MATATGRAVEEPHSLLRPSQIVEVPVGSATIVREIVLDPDTTRSDANSKSEQKSPPPFSPPELSPEPSLGKAEDKPDTGRDKEGPTMAEVRAWVAEPLQQLAELQALQAVPSCPVPEGGVREREEPSSEVYALEIGTIEIVLDSPASSSPPPRAQVAAPSGLSDAQRNRVTRHYLRF